MRELGPTQAVLPPEYDVNSRCEFHSRPPGHFIENCKALKYKVQYLLYSEAITFTPNDQNINNNLMPPHEQKIVNMVELDSGRKVITFVNDLETPLVEIKDILLRSDTFSIYAKSCEYCLKEPQQCEVLKVSIQTLMNQGILIIDRPSTIKDFSTLKIPFDKIPPLQIPYNLSQLTLLVSLATPMIITVLTTFPYNDP